MRSYVFSLILVVLAVTALIAPLAAISNLHDDSQHAYAQNMTSGATQFAISKSAQSMPDPTPGHEQYHQAVIVLPERDDGKVYAGTITYTASLPVEVVVLQPFNQTMTANATATPLIVPETETAITLLHEFEGARFANEVFAGKSLALHSRSPQPFIVSYTAVGEVIDPTPLPK